MRPALLAGLFVYVMAEVFIGVSHESALVVSGIVAIMCVRPKRKGVRR